MGGRTERPTITPSGWVQPLPRSRPRAPTVERWRSHAPRRAAPPEPPSRTRAAAFATLRASQRKFSSATAPPPAPPPPPPAHEPAQMVDRAKEVHDPCRDAKPEAEQQQPRLSAEPSVGPVPTGEADDDAHDEGRPDEGVGAEPTP